MNIILSATTAVGRFDCPAAGGIGGTSGLVLGCPSLPMTARKVNRTKVARLHVGGAGQAFGDGSY